MGGWLAGLGQGAQGILGQRAANEKAVADEQDRGAILAQRAAELAQTQAQAQIEQQKLRMQQQTAAQQQAVIDDIRKRNLMVNYGGQQIPLADVLAMGGSPKDFTTPQNIKMWKGGTAAAPREMATDFTSGTTTDLGSAPAAMGVDPSAKIGGTPIGFLPGGAVAADANGDPINASPMTPLNTIPGVAAILSPKDMDLLQGNKAAVANLQDILEKAKGVLPDNVATTTGEGVRDYIKGMERPVLAAVGPAKYGAFEESKAGIIKYMRGLTGAARVNQQEFQQAVARIVNAKTYPSLEAAVKEAQKLLQEGQKGLVRAGSINTGAGSAPSGDGGWSAPISNPNGVQFRHNGSNWQMLDPNKGWVPVS